MTLTKHLYKPSVLVVGDNFQVQNIFSAKGYRILYENDKKANPDLVIFTGGEDVDPFLYGENKLEQTSINKRRDDRESAIFQRFLYKPKIGICRGGQFLNVLSGGAMWQHVDKHGLSGTHVAIDLLTGIPVDVTSTHHQMMIPGEDGEVIAIADEATTFISDKKDREKPIFDTEVVWYDTTNSLCFQPHPEYSSAKSTREYFFNLVDFFF